MTSKEKYLSEIHNINLHRFMRCKIFDKSKVIKTAIAHINTLVVKTYGFFCVEKNIKLNTK